MRQKLLFISTVLIFSFFRLSSAAQEQASAALQASNLLNPNVSAIGWFQAEVGHRDPNNLTAKDSDAFQLKEVEIALQAVVDPYSRADFIVSITGDGAAVEEG